MVKEIGNDGIKLAYNPRTEKVTVHLKRGYQLGITKKFSIILGFGGKETKITKTTVSPYVADLNGAMTSIYVYCNIVQPQVVGGTNAKLIRNIAVDEKMGKIATRTFTNVQYIPVQTKSFGDIEILLRDDTGNPIPFERGKSTVTLHFKQQASPYFT